MPDANDKCHLQESCLLLGTVVAIMQIWCLLGHYCYLGMFFACAHFWYISCNEEHWGVIGMKIAIMQNLCQKQMHKSLTGLYCTTGALDPRNWLNALITVLWGVYVKGGAYSTS